MKKSVLIIDYESDFIDTHALSLTKEGYNVLTAETYSSALPLIKQSPDLILLNLLMPDMNGLDIVRLIKQNVATSTIPIIVLSSKDFETDEIISLELGADDYLQKPIQTQKLNARIRSILRQQYQLQNKTGDKEILVFNGLEINIPGYLITHNNKTLVFPRKEFDILALLASHPEKVFTRMEIIHAVWGSTKYNASRTLEVHIARIRKKLEDVASSIVTVSRVGYKFHA